jgi:hypothetical protein
LAQFWTDQKSPAAEMIWAEMIMMMRRVMMEENYEAVCQLIAVCRLSAKGKGLGLT